MGNIERDPDDFDLTDEQLEAMRGREDPEVAAVLPEPREVSEAERLRRQLAGAVEAAVQSARDVISLAETAGMPDTYQQSDSRMVRARETLDHFGGQ